MGVFFLILSVSFYFVTHNIYKFIFAPYINNFYLNIIIYLTLFLISQSYILLNNKNINKYLEYILYIVVFVYCSLLFYYLVIDIYRFFFYYRNPQKMDLTVIFILILLGVFGFFNRYFIRVTKYNLKSNKNINLKIAFMSDLHIGDTGINSKILNNVVNKINKENVDLILLGGDVIEQKAVYFTSTKLNEYFKKLKSKYGIYAILGNHEYYSGEAYKISKTLEENNIKILNDDFFETKNFVLIGREDITKNYFYSKRKNINNIISFNEKKYSIVIDHNPVNFNESIDNNIDLQLSGHTHNGQFFPFNLIVKFFHKKAYGLMKKNNSILIVSSGLSTWRIPIKLFSKPEIVIVNINK